MIINRVVREDRIYIDETVMQWYHESEKNKEKYA